MRKVAHERTFVAGLKRKMHLKPTQNNCRGQVQKGIAVDRCKSDIYMPSLMGRSMRRASLVVWDIAATGESPARLPATRPPVAVVFCFMLLASDYGHVYLRDLPEVPALGLRSLRARGLCGSAAKGQSQ